MFVVDKYCDLIREKTEAAIEADKARRPYQKEWHIFASKIRAEGFIIRRAENELSAAVLEVKNKTKRLAKLQKKYNLDVATAMKLEAGRETK